MLHAASICTVMSLTTIATQGHLLLQVWVGRLAMIGFLTSIIQEVNTKKGTLGQVGFITPSPPLLYTIVGVSASAIFTSLAVTFYNATTGKMTARYASNCCTLHMLTCGSFPLLLAQLCCFISAASVALSQLCDNNWAAFQACSPGSCALLNQLLP